MRYTSNIKTLAQGALGTMVFGIYQVTNRAIKTNNRQYKLAIHDKDIGSRTRYKEIADSVIRHI